MSSVTRFLKQIPAGLNYGAVGSLSSSNCYEFVPANGNYVGNYPPGYVQLMNVSAGAAAFDAALALPGAIVRDMGKTINAPVGAVNYAAGQSYSFFRQLQLIVPTVPATPVSASNFGVLGDPSTPDMYTQYYTFYVPVTVGGVGLAAAVANVHVIAGGQL